MTSTQANVSFALNGKQVEVPASEAISMTVNEYLRFKAAPKLSGTKLSCGQGGCGACTISLCYPDGHVKSVNSCLMPLASAHGLAVTTIEGLQNPQTGELHPVQQRVVQFHGTQCGMCTPGAVMQIYASIKSVNGGATISQEQLEKKDFLAGNLCRCTGYRPLHDAIKSFARDTNVVDCIGNGPVGPYDPTKVPEPAFNPQLQSSAAFSVDSWIRPSSMDELREMFSTNSGNPDFMVIAGHTGHGVYGSDMSGLQVGMHRHKKVLQITQVADLHQFRATSDSVSFGSCVTINDLARHLGEIAASRPEVAELLTPAADHLLLIAGHQIRNMGTIGGNIMMVRAKGFASDAAPVLLALGTTVNYIDGFGQEHCDVDLHDFLKQDAAKVAAVLVLLRIPLQPGSILRTYRSSFRPRNAYALANAAFRLDFNGPSNAASIQSARLIFGAIGGVPHRARNTESLFTNKKSSELIVHVSTMLSSVQSEVEIAPSEHSRYRQRQVQAFLFKFVNEICFNTIEDRSVVSSLHARGTRHTKSLQTIPLIPHGYQGLSPVFEPHAKTTAPAQVSGDSRFVDDMPLPAGTLFAAIVAIPRANASFQSVDCSKAQELLGRDFAGILSSADLDKNVIPWGEFIKFGPPPEDKVNNPMNEAVFLPPRVASGYAGQPVAVVLGSSQRIAEQAAAAVVLVGLKSEGEVHINPENAPSMLPKPVELFRGKREATEAVISQYSSRGNLVQGPFVKSSQSHFYMEPQSAIAQPDEEGGFIVHSACQGVNLPHQVFAEMLNLPQSKVQVRFRRIGGGFGGKITRCIPPALIALLASRHTKRPVRLVLPREIDTAMIGGRQELVGNFEAAVDPNGKVRALKVKLDMGAGAAQDYALVHAMMIGQTLDMVYALENVLVSIDLKKTHVPPRTAVRSPAHLEALMIIETVMDTIAETLNLPYEQVREVNFVRTGMLTMRGLSGGILPPALAHDWANPAVWARVKQLSNFEQRQKLVEDFNAKNKWKKRGIALTPAKYGMVRFPGMGAKVDIFKDSSLLVCVGGCELGQGLHTKVGQVACAVVRSKLKVELNLSDIRFADFSTELLPNQAGAGGSTTSEFACFAVEEAMNTLVARMQSFVKAAVKKNEGKPVSWKQLVETCFSPVGGLPGAFDGSAMGFYRPDIKDMLYETFGASCSEVEIDCLTGETKVVRSDLVFDNGPSLNPAIDMGQVEGAYVMGLGQMMLEQVRYDPATGVCLTKNTWDYKVPSIIDIPEEFNVHLVDLEGDRTSGLWGVVLGAASGALSMLGMPWKPTKNRPEFKSAKATGEPPLLLSYSILSAIRRAINAARGMCNPSAPFGAPLTVETVAEFTWGSQTDLMELSSTLANQSAAAKKDK